MLKRKNDVQPSRQTTHAASGDYCEESTLD